MSLPPMPPPSPSTSIISQDPLTTNFSIIVAKDLTKIASISGKRSDREGLACANSEGVHLIGIWNVIPCHLVLATFVGLTFDSS